MSLPHNSTTIGLWLSKSSVELSKRVALVKVGQLNTERRLRLNSARFFQPLNQDEFCGYFLLCKHQLLHNQHLSV